jgi:hypothetical protein
VDENWLFDEVFVMGLLIAMNDEVVWKQASLRPLCTKKGPQRQCY